jgi:hypothetical protein
MRFSSLIAPLKNLFLTFLWKIYPTKKHEDFTTYCGVSLKSTKAENENLVQNLINLVL